MSEDDRHYLEGFRARFLVLWPSPDAKAAACPTNYDKPNAVWQEGWAAADMLLAPLERERMELLAAQSALIAEMLAVTLEACGPNKIATIKAIRSITGLGLVECKNMADTTPSLVGVFPSQMAMGAVRTLRAVGAIASTPDPLERLAKAPRGRVMSDDKGEK